MTALERSPTSPDRRLFPAEEIGWLFVEAGALARRLGSEQIVLAEPHRLDPAFARLVHDPRFVAEAERRCGGPVVLVSSMICPDHAVPVPADGPQIRIRLGGLAGSLVGTLMPEGECCGAIILAVTVRRAASEETPLLDSPVADLWPAPFVCAA